MPDCLSSLRFGSLLVYSPRGRSKTSALSRDITYAIKNDTYETIDRVVYLLTANLRKGGSSPVEGLREMLGPEVLLVPCPRSSLLVAGGLWPAGRICETLVRAGLGREVQPIVTRVHAIRKSARSAAANRPSVREHIESMGITGRPTGTAPARITLVDDVITKGATMLAAASHIAGACPGSTISAFALVRTMGLIPDVDQILDPVVGTITLVGTGSHRNP